MLPDKNQKLFFELLKAGLWGDGNPDIRIDGTTDWNYIYRLVQEQSVQGIVLSGLEELKAKSIELSIPKVLLLQWIGEVQLIEQRNKEMNVFVAELIEKLRKEDVYAILVKGQGIAQCYEKSLWRSSGDVDLLLSESNYERAKEFLSPLATDVETEYTHFKHLGMTIDGWVVELHGTLHSRLSGCVDRMVDEVQWDVFHDGKVRSWQNGRTQVFLPAPDEDVIFVFTHILHHFFFEGIGLRQICDWCRLLWTYKDKLDVALLEKRLRRAGLMSEWKAFAAFAVNWLGMPVEAMPLYSADKKWKKKGDKMCEFVMKVGNFGHKQRRDFAGMPYVKRKFVSFWGRLRDMLRHFTVFPLDTIRFFGGVLRSGLYAAMRGE